MKALLIFLFLLTMASASFSQGLTQQSSSDTIEFKQKNTKPISIAKLKDGKHSFISKDGTKLVLTVKENKVTDHQYYSPTGELVSSSARIADALRQCLECVTIVFPDGKREKVCRYVPCPTAGGINKRLNY